MPRVAACSMKRERWPPPARACGQWDAPCERGRTGGCRQWGSCTLAAVMVIAGSRPRASVAMPRLRPSAERETAQQAVRLGGLPSSRQAAKYQYTVLAGRRRHPPARLVQKHSVFTKAQVDGGHRLRPRLRRRFKHRLGSSPAPTAGGFTALTRQQIAAGPRPPPRSRFQPAAASRASATRAQTECRALPTESATFHFMTGGLPTRAPRLSTRLHKSSDAYCVPSALSTTRRAPSIALRRWCRAFPISAFSIKIERNSESG